MLSKANLTGTFLGFIYLFFSGWIFYESLPTDFFSQNCMNIPSIMTVKMNYIALVVFNRSLSAFIDLWEMGERAIKPQKWL